ncbi:MAG: type II toxin-antitoxin system RelE/ParE family toxin [Microcystis sp. LE19-84.1B]|uniref:type II toxin-antitoxin system RelE/ParE family toxin n=2 Tax=Microcystaceae TaxID=1890449 RepID=UPI0003121E07|nr:MULTISPECIES: type II toxin-antitoxin system RelE/ParE family toxin [Microcystis]MCZ8189467.1 type II toxin-antitoxin system RelE/ParE family toxin [Microcystis sp. LE19-338.1B]MCZ8227357.1 type II toxin-antitoxin system RelE/ParE family toxin [Microcystis sp. LE19-84.1B]MCZ8360377.1 type II toxin-antitoxin system RelE/ParE family toxin [Microcystis sp. LE19-388.1G]
MKRLPAKFFRAEGGAEPVKDWLKTLSREDCRIIGSDIKDGSFSFPIGLPLCRSLSGYKDLWEVRSKLTGGRIARVIFYISQGEMILLHGNIGEVPKNPQTGNRFSSQAQEGTGKI